MEQFIVSFCTKPNNSCSLCLIIGEPLLFQSPCVFKTSPVNNQPGGVNHCLYAKPCKGDVINSCGEKDAMVIGRKSGSLQDKVSCLSACILNLSVAIAFKHSCCISQKIQSRFILASWFLCQIQYLIKLQYYR